MATHQWNNRIIRQADVPPATLLAHPENVALHDAEQLDLLEAVLQQVGWVDRIVVSAATQRILDGHARVIVALRNGEATVPVQEVDATEDEERLGLVVLNRLARLAHLDLGKLDVLLTGVEAVTDDPILLAGLDDFAAFAGLRDDPLDDPLLDDPLLDDDDDALVGADDGLGLTQVRVGDYLVSVPRAVYDAWLDAVRVAVGFDAASINALIRRRLGIEPLSDQQARALAHAVQFDHEAQELRRLIADLKLTVDLAEAAAAAERFRQRDRDLAIRESERVLPAAA